jgi:ATP/maltotriose-dependent transcriptional regulator MalT
MAMTLNKASGPAKGTEPGAADGASGILPMPGAWQSIELESLLEVWARAEDGEGCPVVLVGAPGSGKTRLADQLCRRIKSQGAKVMWTSCAASPDAPSLWPWLQLLREYLRDRPAGTFPPDLEQRMAEVTEMLPGVDDVLQGHAVPETMEPATARFRLFDAVSQLLRRAAAEDPLLVVMDDLHAADEPTLELLRHAGNELWGSRVVVLAVSRPLSSRSPAALRATLETLSRARGSQRVELTAPDQVEHRPTQDLSARESQVAALVVEGMSNRQIGEKLYISERTAENHIQNILNKLGYSTRAQIAAWVERGER